MNADCEIGLSASELGYSELKIENLDRSAILDFKVGRFQPLRGLRRRLVRDQSIKFQQNQRIHGWDIIMGCIL